jgi:c-di-GMP-binding flagellar brake protein YcgR
MTALQQLDTVRINEVLAEASDRHVPIRLAVQAGDQWHALHSRLVAFDGRHLLIEQPVEEGGLSPQELAPAEKVTVSVKLKHHKHIFSSTVAGLRNFQLVGGTTLSVLALCCPTAMHRLQRRAYERVAVPPNRIVRAAVWLGGRQAEPAGASPDKPVWLGQVTNISAGGFQIRTAGPPGGMLDVNDIVGVRLSFGAGEEGAFLEAQFRHAESDGQNTLMGFQFVGLGQSAEGLKALQFVVAKVAQMQKDWLGRT